VTHPTPIPRRVVLWAILALCAPVSGCPTDGAPGVWAIQAEINEVVPTVVHVHWNSAEAGTSYVEYGLGALDLVTPTTPGAATEHDVGS